MAQTKKKRRRKHRGTQGGGISTKPRGRPRNRAEARARAQQRRSGKGGGDRTQQRQLRPPSWKGAFGKGIAAAVFFFVVLMVIGNSKPGEAALLGAFMTAFYVPMAYFVDGFMYRRALRKEQQERQARASGSGD